MVGYGPRLSNKKRCKVGIFAWAKLIIEAKIKNSLSLLLSMGDVYAFSDEELEGMAHSLQCIDQASSVDEVMGFEGNAAKCYFQCYSKLFTGSGFCFEGRNSRPPKDPINALLSYGYSVLHRSITGAIERHGLCPYFGFIHKIKRGHAALSSDLIEEYRTFLVDRTVFGLVCSSEIDSEEFVSAQNGAVYMSKDLMERVKGIVGCRFSEGSVLPGLRGRLSIRLSCGARQEAL